MSNDDNNSVKTLDYERGNISQIATRLLQGGESNKDTVEETKDLLVWIKSIYPEDYELYIESKFNEVSKENVIKVLKNVITMCTSNSL